MAAESEPISRMFLLALTFGLCACASWILTGGVRRYAASFRMLDHPNARSSHSAPTPRGGGIAFVTVFTAGLLAFWSAGLCPTSLAAILLGAGLPVAAIGLLDDRFAVAARWRFSLHTLACGWALWAMNGIPPVPVFGVLFDLGWVGTAGALVYLVWMVNLFNFMDGIDGIASLEAITVAVGGAWCWWLATGTSTWSVPVAFAFCVLGFLIWNYPPAKIFMGDAGSGFIGAILGVLSLWSAQNAQQVFWCWFVLLGAFMVDSTTSLVRRVYRGEQFSEAHRSHAYQYASRKYHSHRQVSLFFAAINIFWLLPISTLVALGKLDGALGVVIAYLPLVWLAFKFKAGARAEQEV